MSRILLAAFLALAGTVHAAETKTSAPAFARFHPVKAADAGGPMLKPGDRRAIGGDSITEQKMYSRIMETYLTVCIPDLAITVRQLGWSGERAPGGNFVKSG